MIAVEAVHLTKSFHRGAPALDDVTFRYEGARAVGYLGPNGAGKSTTLKLFVGLLEPTRGRALLNDQEAIENRKSALWDVGAVIETPEPYETLTVREALAAVAALRGLSSEGAETEIRRLYDELRLPRLDRRCGRLSKGQRQRVILAAAMVGDPPVLLLDEPTSGLDPAERILVRALLRRLKTDHLVFLVSHQVADVAEICDDLLFLDRGRIVLRDTVAHVTANVQVREVDVEFLNPMAPPGPSAFGPGVETVAPLSDRRWRIVFDGSAGVRGRIVEVCQKLGVIANLGPSTAALETAYLDVLRASSQ